MSLGDVSRNVRYLLLSPTRVGGYLLRSKKWAMLAIHNLQPGEVGSADRSLDRALDVLQFDRLLIRASVKNDVVRYFAERKKFMEKKEKGGVAFAHYDGGGLVFHFHGGSFSGHTYTVSEPGASLTSHVYKELAVLARDY
jgi:hypothetical protein